MPQSHNPKGRNYVYPLSQLNDGLQMLRFRCGYCKAARHYYPADLIQIFGDVDVDSLHRRATCETCSSGAHLDVDAVRPVGKDAVGLRIRRLVAIRFRRVPVWKEE